MKFLIANLSNLVKRSSTRFIHHTKLTTAFDHLHLKNQNPNKIKFANNNDLFGEYRLNDPRDFQLMYDETLARLTSLVKEAEDNERKRKLVEIFDNLSNTICKTADLCEFIKLTHPSPRYTIPAEEVSGNLSEIVEQLNTNKSLYLKLKNVVENGDLNFKTDEFDDYVSKLFLHDIEQSGIHLSDSKRNLGN